MDLARSSVMSRSQLKVSPATAMGCMNLQIAGQCSGPASLINMGQTYPMSAGPYRERYSLEGPSEDCVSGDCLSGDCVSRDGESGDRPSQDQLGMARAVGT